MTRMGVADWVES